MANPITYDDLAQHIAKTEQNLREYHDLRVGKLEALVEERDQLLLESSRRFEKLKDDFEYNLSLIQARDVEIERLEHEIRVMNTEGEQFRSEIKDLNMHLEAAMQRETDGQKKTELDRINNKRVFDELKDAIQQMRWAAEEEARIQTKEVESLKSDIKHLNSLREESLESQRRDLTQTFENILHQREEAFASKEREISSQIAILETRFEAIQTENTRLKNELAVSLRKRDQQTEELSQKEEARRQLQWTLEDERAARSQAENLHANQLQQVTLELSMHKENATSDVTELKKKLTQSKEETAREKEFRKAAEGRVEELRKAAKHDLSTLEAELEGCRGLEARQQREIAVLREERESALQRAHSTKVEAEALELRLSSVTVDYDGAAEDLHSCRARLQQSQASLDRLQREFEDHRCRAAERESEAIQTVTSQLVEEKTSRYEEVTQLKKAHAEELGKVKLEFEQKLQLKASEMGERQDGDMFEVQKRLVDRTNELEMARASAEALTAQLEEARREIAALNLRLSVYEAQGLKQQQLIKVLEQQLRESGGTGGQDPRDRYLSAGTGRYSATNQELAPYSPDASLQRDPAATGTSYLHSPMFSEDFGPATFSLPNSPTASMAKSFNPHSAAFRSTDFTNPDIVEQHEAIRRGQREAFSAWGESKTGPPPRAAAASAQDSNREEHSDNRAAAALAEENERLKRYVKEMRTEVEQLHEQMATKTDGLAQSGEQGSARSAGQQRTESNVLDQTGTSQRSASSSFSSLDLADREKFALLEARLQQSTQEIQRLRQERHSVMDVGNKLRSALNKHVLHIEEVVDEATASELIAEADHVRDWLTSAPRPTEPYEFSEDFQQSYRGNSYAVPNSERYRREQQEEQFRQRQQEDVRALQQRTNWRESGGSNRTGVSTAALLGEESDSTRGGHSDHNRQPASRYDAHGHRTDSEQEDSAGRRVWGSPVRREGSSAGRIPAPSAGIASSTGSRSKSRQSSDNISSNKDSSKPSSSDIDMKQSERQGMRLQGQALGSTGVPSVDTAPSALDFSSSSAAAGGNLLTAAHNALPRTNSGRMTSSQMEALRRIQEAKKRNSLHVGPVTSTMGAAPAGGSGRGVGTRRVMNYAKWAEES